MFDLLLLFAFLPALACVIWLADYSIAWLCREVFRLKFSFPHEFQISDEDLASHSPRWRTLGTCRVGGIVTNCLRAARTEEGLAFKMGSLFGYPVMQTVLVPWRSLQLEVPRNNSQTVLIIDGTGEVANRIESGWFEQAWVQRIDSAKDPSAVRLESTS